MKPYNRTTWKDHVVDPGTGAVIQQGTPQSATNFNNMEEGIFAGDAGMSVLSQQVLQHKRVLSDLEGETGQASMTNSQSYPFNNSSVTVNLQKSRDTLNYRVLVEVVSSNGPVGEVVVYDKQLNGFKIKFTGSATAVTVKYYVTGGMYQ
jgi:hypothetical protein